MTTVMTSQSNSDITDVSVITCDIIVSCLRCIVIAMVTIGAQEVLVTVHSLRNEVVTSKVTGDRRVWFSLNYCYDVTFTWPVIFN